MIDRIKGFLPLHPEAFRILMVLRTGERHGYAVVKELERDSGVALLTVEGQTDPKLELCALAAGCARDAMRELGAADVEVHVSACQGVGDLSTVFALGWRPG